MNKHIVREEKMLSEKNNQVNTSNTEAWTCGSGIADDQICESYRTKQLTKQYWDWKLTLGWEGC
jgi:hypothetical protein